eukprot:399626-Prorocentrum_minimum.AAC.1
MFSISAGIFSRVRSVVDLHDQSAGPVEQPVVQHLSGGVPLERVGRGGGERRLAVVIKVASVRGGDRVRGEVDLRVRHRHAEDNALRSPATQTMIGPS